MFTRKEACIYAILILWVGFLLGFLVVPVGDSVTKADYSLEDSPVIQGMLAIDDLPTTPLEPVEEKFNKIVASPYVAPPVIDSFDTVPPEAKVKIDTDIEIVSGTANEDALAISGVVNEYVDKDDLNKRDICVCFTGPENKMYVTRGRCD